MLRANPDGSMLRLKDVARIELGAQTYNLTGRFNGEPSAILAVLPACPARTPWMPPTASRARIARAEAALPARSGLRV